MPATTFTVGQSAHTRQFLPSNLYNLAIEIHVCSEGFWEADLGGHFWGGHTIVI